MSDSKKKGLPDDTKLEETEEGLGQITLTLEDGAEVLCDIIATFPCSNGNSYIALLPVEDEDSDFFLYRYTVTEDGDIDLGDIADDEEFEEASDAFDELMDNIEYDEMFDDEDDDQ